MLSKFARQQQSPKTTNHGGKRYKDTFFERRQKTMCMTAIKAIWEQECGCTPHCLFVVGNKLPNYVDTVESLRAGRFTGGILFFKRDKLATSIPLFFAKLPLLSKTPPGCRKFLALETCFLACRHYGRNCTLIWSINRE